MKTLLFILLIFVGFSMSAQTCAGYLSFRLKNNSGETLPSNKIVKNITFVRTDFYAKIYKTVNEIQTFDNIINNEEFFIDQGYMSEITEDESDVELKTLCGYYLILIEMVANEQRMRMGFFNVPAHISFSLDDIQFSEGDYYVDIQTHQRLSKEIENKGNGYFFIPDNLIQKFK